MSEYHDSIMALIDGAFWMGFLGYMMALYSWAWQHVTTTRIERQITRIEKRLEKAGVPEVGK